MNFLALTMSCWLYLTLLLLTLILASAIYWLFLKSQFQKGINLVI